MIQESYLDTNATILQIRTQLSALDDFMESRGHDNTNFNRNVKVPLDLLKARGETTINILTNIFKWYAA